MFPLPSEIHRPLLTAVIPSAQEPETPADQVQPARPEKTKRKRTVVTYLREEEIERLFSVIDSVRDRAIFRLAYHAGLHASEVGKLEITPIPASTRALRRHVAASRRVTWLLVTWVKS